MKSFFRLPLLLDLINSYFTYILVVPLIVAPLERIKVIMQTNSKVQGQWACFKNILFTEGIRGVFKGNLFWGIDICSGAALKRVRILWF